MIPTNLQGIEPSFVYVPTQAKRPHRNNHFNLFSGCSTFPNALQFPSFHKVQKMHIGVICQTFFCFFWTKEPCQIKGVSLTMEGPTQTIPNRKNKSCHRTLDMMQWRRMWSIDSLWLYIDNIYSPTMILVFEADLMSILFSRKVLKQNKTKKVHFCWDPRIPSHAWREGHYPPRLQDSTRISMKKIPFFDSF